MIQSNSQTAIGGKRIAMSHNPTPVKGFERSLAKNRDTISLIQSWLRSDTTEKRTALIDQLPGAFKTRVFNAFSNVRRLLSKAEDELKEKDRTLSLIKQSAHFVIYEEDFKEECKQAQYFCEQSNVGSVKIVFDLKEMRCKATLRPATDMQIEVCEWVTLKEFSQGAAVAYLVAHLTVRYTQGNYQFIFRKKHQS